VARAPAQMHGKTSEIQHERAGVLAGLANPVTVEGVQFHPESILTLEGKKLLANFLES